MIAGKGLFALGMCASSALFSSLVSLSLSLSRLFVFLASLSLFLSAPDSLSVFVSLCVCLSFDVLRVGLAADLLEEDG